MTIQTHGNQTKVCFVRLKMKSTGRNLTSDLKPMKFYLYVNFVTNSIIGLVFLIVKYLLLQTPLTNIFLSKIFHNHITLLSQCCDKTVFQECCDNENEAIADMSTFLVFWPLHLSWRESKKWRGLGLIHYSAFSAAKAM